MRGRWRRVGSDERLTLVQHLDELRARALVCLAAFGVALGLAVWQNHLLLRIINAPLHGRRPLTLSPTEPFTTTLSVSAYAAVLLSAPVILYELYAFVVPAFKPREKRIAAPLMVLAPALFMAGAAFGYFVVVPAALKFLLHFNSREFNIQARAAEYYSFVSMAVVASGAVFQVPIGVLGLVWLEITTPEKLRRRRPHAVLVCAIVAAALPGVDPVSMVLEMLPLVALYELSIWLASFMPQRREAGLAAAASTEV